MAPSNYYRRTATGRAPFLLLAVALLSSCATTQRQLEEALSLDVDHFKQTMHVKDDPMEVSATFSTHKGFQAKHGLLGVVWSDSFLRGFVDKRTGEKTFQVYVVLRHTTNQWALPYQANYGRPLRTSPVQRVSSNVDCSAKDLYGSCRYEEHAVFTVEEAELRRVQRDATPEDFKSKGWLFKVKNRSGQDYDDGILLPEVIALLEAMDSYAPVAMQ